MAWAGSLFIGNNRVLFVGEADEAMEHSLPAIKICAALNGNFKLSIDSKSKLYSAAIIGAQTKHSVDSRSAKLIVLLYLLPLTKESIELKGLYLLKDQVHEISPIPANKLLSRLGELHDHWNWTCITAFDACHEIIGELIDKPSSEMSRFVNAHIRRIIEYLYSEIEKQQSAPSFDLERFEPDEIIDELKLYDVGWNKENFKSKFKRLTGTAYKDVEKMLRLRAALINLGTNRTARSKAFLTQVAVSVGFDLHQLGAVFRDMLGINPSILEGDSRFINCKEIDGNL